MGQYSGKIRLALLSLTILLFSCKAQKGELFPFEINRIVLDNGLQVISVPYDSPGVVAYLTIARVGSRNEVEQGRTGYAHFFEHMMFRGTEKYPQQRYNEIYRTLGAESNAFTGDDWTCYFTVAGSEAIEEIIDLESDRFMRLSYSEEAFKSEATVILGEYHTSSSSPYLTMFEKLHEAAFTRHTYGHTTMGYLKDVENMPYHYDYSVEFFHRFYRPENCIVVVVGDFDQGELRGLIQEYYGDWARGAATVDIPVELPQAEEKKIDLSWENETLPFLLVGYRVPGFSEDDIDVAAIHLLSQLVFSYGSPLHQKLVIDEQTVEFLNGELEDHVDPCLFTVMACIRDPENIDAVRNDVFQAIEDVQTEPVSRERLDRVKSHMKYSFAMGLKTPLGVAFSLAHYLALTGEPESLNRFYELFDRVRPDDIQRVAETYFAPTNRTVVTLTYGGER